jgi:hypothetical protein
VCAKPHTITDLKYVISSERNKRREIIEIGSNMMCGIRVYVPFMWRRVCSWLSNKGSNMVLKSLDHCNECQNDGDSCEFDGSDDHKSDECVSFKVP